MILQKKRSERDETNRELVRNQVRIEQERKTIRSLEAQINATGVASRSALLESEGREIDLRRSDVLRRLQARFAIASSAVGLLGLRESLEGLHLGEVFNALEQIRRRSAGSAPPDWPSDPVTLDRLLDEAGKAANAVRGRVEAARDEAIAYRRQAREQVAEATGELQKARAGQVTLTPRSEALIEALRRQDMEPYALCELAAVVDESWREAAEALLGRDREAVLVEPDHAQRAVEIFRRGRDSYRGCRVVNTRRGSGRNFGECLELRKSFGDGVHHLSAGQCASCDD